LTVKKALIVPLVLATACGGSAAFKDQAREAMPDKSSVAMTSPAGTNTALKSAPSTGLTAAATSNDFFFGLTVGVAATFNVPVAVFLDIVANVTQSEPTSCTATSCTWGPGSSALDFNNYELTVSRDADGISFDWALSGQPKSRPGASFVQIASGVAKPSGTPHHGSGSFSIDFDAAATLDGPHNATGKLQVTSYDNVGPAQLSVTYLGATDGTVTTQLDNIGYTFAENAQGGGDLQFAIHNTTTQDKFSVHSRWKNDGSGRADLQGVGNSLTVQDSDCWGPAPFTQVFFTSNITVNSPPFAGPTTGSESACAFTPVVYSSLTVQ
jgi:hypothetical protein